MVTELQFGKYHIPASVLGKMRDKISLTYENENEYGFIFCTKPKSNFIFDEKSCSGSDCAVKLETKCSKPNVYVGDFHTHPSFGSEPTNMSLHDIVDTCRLDKLSCVGFAEEKNDSYIPKVSCYLFKDIGSKKEKEIREECAKEARNAIIEQEGRMEKVLQDKYFDRRTFYIPI